MLKMLGFIGALFNYAWSVNLTEIIGMTFPYPNCSMEDLSFKYIYQYASSRCTWCSSVVFHCLAHVTSEALQPPLTARACLARQWETTNQGLEKLSSARVNNFAKNRMSHSWRLGHTLLPPIGLVLNYNATHKYISIQKFLLIFISFLLTQKVKW